MFTILGIVIFIVGTITSLITVCAITRNNIIQFTFGFTAIILGAYCFMFGLIVDNFMVIMGFVLISFGGLLIYASSANDYDEYTVIDIIKNKFGK